MTRRERRTFSRPPGQRPYRRVFTIATEGAKTEPSYFRMFDGRSGIQIEFVPTGCGSSPDRVLAAMKRFLRANPPTAGDEAWIVVDRDQWTDEQLSAVHAWSLESVGRGLAVSNPKFEYWLLLHFEDGNDIAGARQCQQRLERHLPNYQKAALEITKLEGGVVAAVEQGRRRDAPPCADWPRTTGTTVYRLVERLLAG